MEGVTIDNLLTVHSKPRNMRLAMAMVRLGYAERSGRGVDRAFEGSLRFGRLAPDYSQTTPSHVSVTISTSAADLGFFRFILEAEAKRGKDERLSVYELSILAKLRLERELSAVHLGERLSLPPERLRGVIERLVEEGLISPKGHGRGRVYLLSKDAYDALGRPDGAHDRQVGQTEAQLTQAILDLLERSPWIARRDLIQTLGLEKGRAGRLLTKLANAGLIRMEGKGKGTKYMKR